MFLSTRIIIRLQKKLIGSGGGANVKKVMSDRARGAHAPHGRMHCDSDASTCIYNDKIDPCVASGADFCTHGMEIRGAAVFYDRTRYVSCEDWQEYSYNRCVQFSGAASFCKVPYRYRSAW